MSPSNYSVLSADPAAAHRAHSIGIDATIRRVLDSGRYILGREVESFENEFAQYLGSKLAVGVGSGTDALVVALRACGIGPGELVATVSHTAVATIAAIELIGAVSLLIDINPRTFTIDPNLLEEAVKKCNGTKASSNPHRIRAVIPVHLYGRPAEMTAICTIANRYELLLIEDCAHSH